MPPRHHVHHRHEHEPPSGAQPKSGSMRLERCTIGGAQPAEAPLPYPSAISCRSAMVVPPVEASTGLGAPGMLLAPLRSGATALQAVALMRCQLQWCPVLQDTAVYSCGPVVMGQALHTEHTYTWEPQSRHAGPKEDLASSDQSAQYLDAEMDNILLCGLRSHPESTAPPEARWQLHQFGESPCNAGSASLKPVKA